MKNVRVPLACACFLLGVLARVHAVSLNWFIHGDIGVDAAASASLLRYGSLLTFPQLPEEPRPGRLVLPPAESGDPLAQHGPVWPLLGAGLTLLRGGEASVEGVFLSLRLLSLLSGMFIVLLSAIVAVKLIGREAGVLVLSVSSLSFLLIDYSGNGSLYSLQAVLYLLWLLVALRPASSLRSLGLGAITGVAYLVNFQSIVLLPAGIALLSLEERSRISRALVQCLLLACAASVIASPWLIRNAITFGDPFYSHSVNMVYVLLKAGIPFSPERGDSLTFSQWVGVLMGIASTWMPNNLYYAARKLFLLLPVLFFFFSYAWAEYLFDGKRAYRLRALLLLFSAHLLISGSWPVWKFRYFVPLLPLVLLIALEHLYSAQMTGTTRRLLGSIAIVSTLLMSILTYRAVPTHTTYYDGAVTQDAFHGEGEAEFVREFRLDEP